MLITENDFLVTAGARYKLNSGCSAHKQHRLQNPRTPHSFNPGNVHPPVATLLDAACLLRTHLVHTSHCLDVCRVDSCRKRLHQHQTTTIVWLPPSTYIPTSYLGVHTHLQRMPWNSPCASFDLVGFPCLN